MYKIKFKKKYLTIIFILIFIISYFHYFIIGTHFPDKSDTKSGYYHEFKTGFHQKVPDYVFEAINHINSDDSFGRVLLLPNYNTHIYDWGYSSTGDITAELLKKGVLWATYSEGFTNNNDHIFYLKEIYNQIYTGNFDQLFESYVNELSIKYFLLRKDFNSDFYQKKTKYDEIKNIEDNLSGLNFEKIKFDKWNIYKSNVTYKEIETLDIKKIISIDSYKNYHDKVFHDLHKNGFKYFVNKDALKKLVINKNDQNFCKKDILYKKINHSIYKLSIEDICKDKKYLLKFNTAFNKGWLLFDGLKIHKPEKINFYQNLFYINNIKKKNLYLIFIPTYINLFFFFFSLIVFIVSILYFKIKKIVI